jgi:cell volume regulation protein A
VPIVLATFVLSSDVAEAETIFNAVFFVVVVSASLQGPTLEWVAARLGLVDKRATVTAPPLEVDALGSLELVEFDVSGDHAIAGAAVRELGLPRRALVAVVARGTETIPPRGSTVLQPGDRLFVLAPRPIRAELEDVFTRWRRRV